MQNPRTVMVKFEIFEFENPTCHLVTIIILPYFSQISVFNGILYAKVDIGQLLQESLANTR